MYFLINSFFKLQNYFINLKMSTMQHGQYQTVARQYQTIQPSFCPPFQGGTVWVTNFVRLCLFSVVHQRLKSESNSFNLLF
jgi:hypothetical protein